MPKTTLLPILPLIRTFAWLLVGLSCLSPTQAAWGQKALLDDTAKTTEAVNSPEIALNVGVTVDFGDGFSLTYAALPWSDGITVLDAMLLAGKHAHPLIFKHRGTQDTAFLMAIHGIENQGGDGRNWIFKVNGKTAKQSFGRTPLAPNDSVSWHFKGHEGDADPTNP